MKSPTSRYLRVCVRLSLGLLLLGLCLALGVQIRPAHAAQTLTITDCSNDTQLQTNVNTANTESGDTITFNCSGGTADILVSSTLNIIATMTIDGSGQNITLDGHNQVLPIYVGNSGSLVGNLTLNAITIAHGVNNNGGGLLVGLGSATITNSTFVNNSSTGSGGAITNAGTMTITNSTFTNNSASGYGGAIADENTLTISNSTVSGNAASNGGGGILITQGANLSIVGSIVAENTSSASGKDCGNFGTFTDQGYNIDSDSSCFTASTSTHANPLLSVLANNGGPTQTMALQQGSPAIDQVPLASCSSTDQRGDPRPDVGTPSETTCDMGAYESKYTSSLSVNGTNVSAKEGAAFNGVVATGTYSGSGTLSASINWGDGTTASTGTVSLNAGTYSVSGSHTYAEEGHDTIGISVSDGQGQSASTTASATVSDAALTFKQFAAGPLGHLTGGVAALFTDADPAGIVSDYTVTVTWGDGTNSTFKVVKNPQGKGFVLAGTHHYAKKGIYSVKLTVTDQGGSQLTKTGSVTIK